MTADANAPQEDKKQDAHYGFLQPPETTPSVPARMLYVEFYAPLQGADEYTVMADPPGSASPTDGVGVGGTVNVPKDHYKFTVRAVALPRQGDFFLVIVGKDTRHLYKHKYTIAAKPGCDVEAS